MTPLHCAAKEGHYEVVRYLVEQKADTNSKDDLEVCFFNFFCDINSMHQQLFVYAMMCGCHHGNHLMYLQGDP